MDLRRLRCVQNVAVNSERPARLARWRRARPADAHFENDRERVEALLILLADKRHRLSRSALGITVALSTGMLLSGWLLLFLAQALHILALMLFAGLLPFAGLLAMLRVTKTLNAQRVVLRQLSGYDDVRVTGPLISALLHPDRRLRHAAQIALARVLPRLTAADAVQIAPACRAGLYRYLTPHHAERSPEFVCGILKALEQIGDRNALTYVSGLAYLRGPSANQKKVQQTARECLPFLNARIEQNQVSQDLLRVPNEPADAAAHALRPASAPLPDPELRNVIRPDA